MDFEYRVIPDDNWRRLTGTTAKGTDGPRPHIVPTTAMAKSFASMDAFGAMGRTGLCPGEVLIDGEWVVAYRFVELKPEVAVDIIKDLEGEMLHTTVVEIC